MTIFISYAREDEEIAVKLYKDLLGSNVKSWLDLENLSPGENWKLAIEEAIRNSSYFIALLSKKSVSKSGYVQKELKEALDILDELPSGKIFIIPVRIDECKLVDRRLVDLHWVNLFPSYEKCLSKILKSINSNNSLNLCSFSYNSFGDSYRPEAPILEMIIRSPIDPGNKILVQALLDTGADTTHVPIHILEALNCHPIGRSRQFIGFSESTYAYPFYVSIDLASYEIQGVVVYSWEQSIALIGRNILNGFRVEFDGPGKSFSISPE